MIYEIIVILSQYQSEGFLNLSKHVIDGESPGRREELLMAPTEVQDRYLFMERSECCKPGFPLRVTVFVLAILIVTGCASRQVYRPQPKAGKQPARMGYTIQAGAFHKVENAVQLTKMLRERGLDATYLVDPKGLYKVRFGNFPLKAGASQKAESLRSAEIIDDYYIVSPEEYAVAKKQTNGVQYVREELVKTAQSFIDVPYLWGGSSSDTGFDCSGLTMTVYQLNGIDLPRSSMEQYEAGIPVKRDSLTKGDLVFFATSGSDKVSHVGVYVGGGRFIHAPGIGKIIRIDSLADNYFRKRYLGGRSYL